MLEMEKSFYPSCAGFAVYWLLLCKEKDLLPVRCSLLPPVSILQPVLQMFSPWRKMVLGLYSMGLPCFAPVTPPSHRGAVGKGKQLELALCGTSHQPASTFSFFYSPRA